MFTPPQQSGSYDSEAEAKRRAERITYPSIWSELWFAVTRVLRLPFGRRRPKRRIPKL
jgi:hypothetical protein